MFTPWPRARDFKGFRWMRKPDSSLRIISLALLAYGSLELLGLPNPLSNFVTISYPLPLEPKDNGVRRYGKGYADLAFLAFYVVVFSFVRQFSVLYIARPLAIKGGIRGTTKIERFTEQGYAFMYWGSSSVWGLWVMSKLPIWWYNTSAFWIDYPHWRMLPELKLFYLLQFSYWLQQLLVMVLRLEKPRSDFVELVLHHIVTLWLIGWSYFLNLSYIGIAVFFSMDIADVFLAFSKMLNYLKLQRSSEVSFAAFLAVWTYFRHWLNFRILWSVWYEYPNLVPEHARFFEPSKGYALAGWMRYQVFAPIFGLQLINLFWYVLLWRITFRILMGNNASDTREEGEDDEEEEEVNVTTPANGAKAVVEDKKSQ